MLLVVALVSQVVIAGVCLHAKGLLLEMGEVVLLLAIWVEGLGVAVIVYRYLITGYTAHTLGYVLHLSMAFRLAQKLWQLSLLKFFELLDVFLNFLSHMTLLALLMLQSGQLVLIQEGRRAHD